MSGPGSEGWMPRHAPRVGGGSSVGPGSPYCLLHTPLGNACGESSGLHPLRVLLARRALCPGLRGHPGPSALSWTSLVGALARTRSAELAAAEVLDAPAFLSAFVQVAGYRVWQFFSGSLHLLALLLRTDVCWAICLSAGFC